MGKGNETRQQDCKEIGLESQLNSVGCERTEPDSYVVGGNTSVQNGLLWTFGCERQIIKQSYVV